MRQTPPTELPPWQQGIVLLALCALCSVLLLNLQFADYDLFARIAVGRLIERDAAIPLTDVFSFSETKAIWYDHEWLSGLVFYQAAKVAGDWGLLAVSLGSLFLTAYFSFIVQQGFVRAPLIGALLLAISFASSIGMWAAIVRSHVTSFLFFAMLLFLLERLRQHRSRLAAALIVCIFAVWSNMHGGFVVGFGLLGVYFSVALLKRHPERSLLFATGLASTLALLINPYGPGYLHFIVEAVSKSRPTIDEWSALPPHPWDIIAQGHSVFLLFFALLVAAILWGRKTLRLEGIIFCCFACAYGVTHVRLLPFFYISCSVFLLPLVSAVLAKAPQRYEVPLQRLIVLFSCGALVCTTYLLIPRLRNFAVDTSAYPVQQMQWLRENYPAGRVLGNFNIGSFLLWRGYPEFLVAVDGRYEEVYEDVVVERVQFALSRKHPEADGYLQKINPDFVILCGEERQRGLPSEWIEAYAEQPCSVYVKEVPVGGYSTTAARVTNVWRPHF